MDTRESSSRLRTPMRACSTPLDNHTGTRHLTFIMRLSLDSHGTVTRGHIENIETAERISLVGREKLLEAILPFLPR